MQLNITTDYAIRILIYLSERNTQVIPSKELSEVLCIPQSYVLKVLKKLSTADIIKMQVGVNGGSQINHSPEDINLFQITKLMEPTMKINKCLEADEYCSRDAITTCSIRKMYCRIQDQVEEKLSSITIQSLLEECNDYCN